MNAARYALEDEGAYLEWIDSYYRQAGKPVPEGAARAMIINHTRYAMESGSDELHLGL